MPSHGGGAPAGVDANLITGPVFGSLRAGLTAGERGSIRQGSLLSPSMGVLQGLGLVRAIRAG